jgi:hypothetical protein
MMPSTKEVAQDLSADILAIKDKLTDDEFKTIQEKLGGLSKSKPDRPQFVKVAYALVKAETDWEECCSEINGKTCYAILEIMNIPDVCDHCDLPEQFVGYGNFEVMFHKKCKIGSKTIERFHAGTQDKTFTQRMSVCHDGGPRTLIVIIDISEPF